jgi:hypothetical protein
MFQSVHQPNPEVLIIEDDPAIALDLSTELQDLGFQVAGPFAFCRDALAWLARNELDCAIVDVELPDGSGLQVASELLRCIWPGSLRSYIHVRRRPERIGRSRRARRSGPPRRYPGSSSWNGHVV